MKTPTATEGNIVTINETTFINLVKKCPKSYNKINCKFLLLRKLFASRIKYIIPHIDNQCLNELINEHLECSNESTSETRHESKKNTNKGHLIWKNRINIGILTYELKKMNWIKSQNEFSNIFSPDRHNNKLHWNRNYISHLAYLIFILKEKGYIRCQNTKGHFKMIEEILVDFNNESFPKNSLVKLSSKIIRDNSKYSDIVSLIENILNVIER